MGLYKGFFRVFISEGSFCLPNASLGLLNPFSWKNQKEVERERHPTLAGLNRGPGQRLTEPSSHVHGVPAALLHGQHPGSEPPPLACSCVSTFVLTVLGPAGELLSWEPRPWPAPRGGRRGGDLCSRRRPSIAFWTHILHMFATFPSFTQTSDVSEERSNDHRSPKELVFPLYVSPSCIAPLYGDPPRTAAEGPVLATIPVDRARERATAVRSSRRSVTV